MKIEQKIISIDARYDILDVSHKEMKLIIQALEDAKIGIQEKSNMWRRKISQDQYIRISEYMDLKFKIKSVCEGL